MLDFVGKNRRNLDRQSKEDFQVTDKPYMVIYLKGDRSILSTAYVRFYEKDRWDLASEEGFDSREEAEAHARTLARKHHLALDKEIPQPLDDVPAPDTAMRLYSWESKAMQGGYGYGQIAVMAPTPDVARNMVRKRVVQEPFFSAHQRVDLEADLAAEPKVMASGVILVQGSD
jgi:hypothetical protein